MTTTARSNEMEKFRLEYGRINVEIFSDLTPTEAAVYGLADARGKGYPRTICTRELLDYLPLVTEDAVYSAIDSLWGKGYINRFKKAKGGMWHCSVIYNPHRFPDRLAPVPKANVPASRAAYRRTNVSPVGVDGELVHVPRPMCVARKNNGQGPPCGAHAIADSDLCYAHHGQRARITPAVDSVITPAVDSVLEVPSISPREGVGPVVETTAQGFVLKAAGRAVAVATDRTAALLDTKEGLKVSEGACDPGTQVAREIQIPLPHDLPDDELVALIEDVKTILADHPGKSTVVVHVNGKNLRLPEAYRVEIHGRLYAQLHALLGADARIEVDRPKPPAITDLLDAAVAA
jgi:hypothetical protein